MSEAFGNTLRRDYLDGANRSTVTVVLEHVSHWIDDYNGVAPHSAFDYCPPMAYRRLQAEKAQAVSAVGRKKSTVHS